MAVLISAVLLSAVQLAAVAEPSKIVVEGFGSVKTAPDVVNLSYDVRGEGATSDKALSAMVAKSAAVESSLRSIDPEIDLHSTDVRIKGVRPKGCQEGDYEESPPLLSTGECGISGYIATQDYTVRTVQVSKAGTLVGLAGRHGAYNPNIANFGLQDQTAAKRAAIAAAMADAQTKADAVAGGTGVRRGAILSVSLDNARQQSTEIVITGSMRRRPAAERDPIAVSVNPVPVETTAQVTVSYAIAR